VEASRVEGEIISESGALSHIQKSHPPRQIIGNLNESVTRSSRSAHPSCGGPNHFARKCHTLKHLVELYQKSPKKSNNNKRSYETHFNDMTKEASTSGTIPSNLEMIKLIDTDDMDMENMIVKYNSNDVYGDLK
jgi:hypothetical protein